MWITDTDFIEIGGTKEALVELINEDWYSFIFDECGGIEGIVQRVEIV
jgi:hypothetical protein